MQDNGIDLVLVCRECGETLGSEPVHHVAHIRDQGRGDVWLGWAINQGKGHKCPETTIRKDVKR